MTEFEKQFLFYMKCLNKRLAEIREELHKMNGYVDNYENETEDEDD